MRARERACGRVRMARGSRARERERGEAGGAAGVRRGALGREEGEIDLRERRAHRDPRTNGAYDLRVLPLACMLVAVGKRASHEGVRVWRRNDTS